ncbi:hypothetical protein ANSO36C_31760 [Nostoc cf. commune SO-36]|uniref:Ankyrin n=1 Tax=Nostoc cf. commune SO-36 TaxID=449208 RepID=A0ABM7Z311_NOSCO|nr:ankyrin repeat domain-containing protein [Nostoc commune]BDI17374.1 hypothetical protein ANSO36C_31760 [Nostoc cf. commune SO-36]
MLCKCLLNKGADVQIKNRLGDTPLLVAALQGHSHIVEALLRSGGDINEKNLGESTFDVGGITRTHPNGASVARLWC